ncbi:MAG: PPOX class F420-dependent oxidoreductase [Nitrososphaerota archaeon]|nr:PPOX class F420-dependent oxidoreductase [Nitrososphaerota archaeon]
MIGRSSAEGRRTASFTESEATYLAENFLGRVATVSRGGHPHVVPVSYKFDGKTIAFGGWGLESSLKYKHLMANPHVAFVVDDIASTDPWRVRGIEVRGEAELTTSDGVSMIVIFPLNIRSWGLGY